MGQRSQIYVRYTDEKGKVKLMASYYQWNYDERMISRARYGIEWLLDRMKKSEDDWSALEYEWDKANRIFDINFDMRDIVDHIDLIEEYKEMEPPKDIFNDYIFIEQDNNDGKLFVDVNEQNYKIKYAFLGADCNCDNIMDGYAYRDYDNEGNIYENWRVPNEYENQETIDTSIKNIEAISEMAELMTKEDVKNFIEYDYTDACKLYPFS